MSNHVDPTRNSFDAFKALPRDEPVEMLNLLRLRDRAVYADGRDASGYEAYRAYGEASGPIFRRVGGKIIWRGQPRGVLIGPGDETWDLAFIAAYPSAAAFLEMVTDTVYQADAVPHRVAAVLDSRLIRNKPQETGDAFG
ncbi:DUF1330 domain-containing protein [Maricaulaceae bacterium MS644]